MILDEFTIPKGTKAWDLVWSYDCPGAVPPASSEQSPFLPLVDNALDVMDAVASGFAASDQGVAHNSDTGQFSIHVQARTACT